MPRRLRSAQLETRTARLKLKPRGRVYAEKVAVGLWLGYRRNRTGAGSWSVRTTDGKGGKPLMSLGVIADDYEEADGEHVLTFDQAADKARAFARGHDQHGRPGTLDEALRDYAQELQARGGDVANAKRVRKHTYTLLTKQLGLLSARELKRWRGSLLAHGMSTSTFRRTAKAFQSALYLAADHDPRLDHMRSEWRKGLAAVHSETEERDRNVVLSPAESQALLAACYDVSPELGLYVETLQLTASRPSQIALLNVGDLRSGVAPVLLVPTSRKGMRRTSAKRAKRVRKPIPIPVSLAQKLATAAAGRPAEAPLLPRRDGSRWHSARAENYYKPFARAAAAAGLAHVTVYAFRHTRITTMLLAGLPLRTIADLADTSTAMIEATYSKNIGHHSDALIRGALFKEDTPAAVNVVPLRR